MAGVHCAAVSHAATQAWYASPASKAKARWRDFQLAFGNILSWYCCPFLLWIDIRSAGA